MELARGQPPLEQPHLQKMSPLDQNLPSHYADINDRSTLNCGHATRFEKLATNHLAFVKLASIRL